jgi:hypothetical protein
MIGCGRRSTPAAVVRENSPAPPAIAVVPRVDNDPGNVMLADVAAEVGLSYSWPLKPRPLRTPDAFGTGCAFFDYDQDGWQDVLLVCDPHALLFHNQGGKFEDVSAGSGLAAVVSGIDGPDDRWTGCAVGDYDGDGFPDLLLTGIHRLALFKNDEGKRFVEATKGAGLDGRNRGHWGAGAGFMDLDGDRDLDLVLLNYVVFGPHVKQYCEYFPGVKSGCSPREYEPEFGEIWRNTAAGGFELVPAEMGMQGTHGVGLVLAFTDLDDDGLTDFYIGNDGVMADLLHNLGGMKFENIGDVSGVAWPRFSAMAAMGADFGDYDRDGRLDLIVSDWADRGYAVFHYEGDKVFTETGAVTKILLATRNRLGFGAKWLDLENDGWLDISFVNGHVYDNVAQIEKNQQFRQPLMLFRNNQGRDFVDLVPRLSSDVGRPMVARGSATGDFNNDGRVDLLVVDFEGPVMLLENRTSNDNHWITIDLRAPAPNRHAYGARITARSGEQIWVSEVSPASSYLSSSDPRIHLGLGAIDTLQTVTIRWPDGQEQTLTDVAANQFLRIEHAPK